LSLKEDNLEEALTNAKEEAECHIEGVQKAIQ